MRSSSSTHSTALAMIRALLAPNELASRLDATVPRTVAAEGGGTVLVALYGAPTGAQFWTLRPFPESLWEVIAVEHQAPHRGNVGEPSVLRR